MRRSLVTVWCCPSMQDMGIVYASITLACNRLELNGQIQHVIRDTFTEN